MIKLGRERKKEREREVIANPYLFYIKKFYRIQTIIQYPLREKMAEKKIDSQIK